MKIKMIVSKDGYPAEGETIDVSEARAERWVLQKGLAEFVEKKDRVAISKKVEEAKKAAAEADKQLGKRLDKIDAGEGVED